MTIKAETDAPAYLAQQPTLKLSTPPATQRGVNDNVWGALISKSKGLAGYEFHKARGQHTYLIGSRSRSGGEIGEPVDIVLPKTGISNLDCRIQWDGGSAAWIVDFSDNGAGVFKNDSRLKHGEYNLLRSGDEIAFGVDTTNDHSGEDHVHRFRFVYYHRLPDPPANGVEKHYDFIYVLGKGAYATVYKASSRENARWYAVKVIGIQQLSLSPDWVKDLANGPPTDPDVKKLLKEVTILERLHHKNICQLKEYFVERHRISLVMELVEGGDLWTHLKAKGRAMTESETGQIIYQICDALAYIHTHNIAHRDLKLENVLLTLDNPPVVQVADFGLAKALSTLSDLRTFCGTLAYIAPEVAMKGNDRYTVVADSWSLGIMAFNMLTFESRPYMKGVTDADRQIQVTTRQVNWELLKKHGISKKCERFLRGLLEYDPLRRTTMAAALRDPWLRAHAPKAPSSPREDPVPASLSAEVPAPAHTHAGRQLVHDIIPPSELQPARRARRRTTSRVTAKGVEQQSSDTHTGVAVVDDARVKGTGRARKRKVQDRSDASLSLAIKLEMSKDIDVVAAGAAAAAMEPAKSSGKGKRTAARAPAKKKVHTGGARMTMPAADDSDEVPGLVLPRRSPRLNSPRL